MNVIWTYFFYNNFFLKLINNHYVFQFHDMITSWKHLAQGELEPAIIGG